MATAFAPSASSASAASAPAGPTATVPSSPAPAQALDWKTQYSSDAWKYIRWEGIYLGCIAFVLGAAVISMLLLSPFAKHPETKPLLICVLGGITGSWIYSIKIFVTAISRREWKQDYVAWRLSTPFAGIFLSVSTYAMIRTGMLGVTFVATSQAEVDRNYYAYAIGFLVGLFSDEVMLKLTEVAKTLFGPGSAASSVAEKNPKA